jgi:hypothetical protein
MQNMGILFKEDAGTILKEFSVEIRGIGSLKK